jgi:uncharacterized membrane protein YdfJ with MMPL/SSD domain
VIVIGYVRNVTLSAWDFNRLLPSVIIIVVVIIVVIIVIIIVMIVISIVIIVTVLITVTSAGQGMPQEGGEEA